MVTRSPRSGSESARLFADAPIAHPAGVYVANIDGASRGNPGPAAYAVVVRDPDGKVILELGKRFGRDTNNVAEYYALLAALDYANSSDIKALRVRSDSELLVRQIQGRYKVKSPDLKPLHERALKLSRQLQYFTIEHVRREQNRDADALANAALDGTAPVSAAGLAEDSARQPRGPSLNPRRIRVRFEHGVFVPLERADVAEGSEVLIEIQPK
ncbi:MAG: reverse transcriptase-like protein [Acidobacteriota bacterium]|nr:reverse transcriptase-like protein [Acidobacteriota bacterium]MDE3171213.1 reverse transcriptase-like protein [Acidobacteriota bacterium]